MIILIIGGIGTGKTLSVVREIVEKKQFCYTNFPLKGIKNYHRMKFSDIILKTMDGKKEKKDVNWAFWDAARKSHESFSVYIDEIHNVIHSRRSMSGTNILFSKWGSQIRKVLHDSPHNHLYLISQTIRKIDVDFRDIAHAVITTKKFKIHGKIYIKQRIYPSIEHYYACIPKYSRVFCGERYFKYYDSTGLIKFSDGEDYV